jgi:MFS family permease
MSASPAGPIAPDLARARHHLIGLYFLTGVAVATWLARLPSIRTALDLSAAELGTVLVVGSVGSLAMVVVAGGLTNRWGSRRTLLTAAVMFSVANVLVGIGPAVGSVGLLSVGILVSSSSYALSNVPMNLETVVIERAMGRAVVPQFHAAFSVGSVTGSLIGAGVSWLGVPVVWHFVALSAVTLGVRALAIPGAVLPLPGLPAGVLDPTSGHGGGGMRAAFAAWREPRTLVIGLIVMVGALSEGSANNWMTIAVVDGFVQTEAVAAVVFGVFVGSMTVARLLGTHVIERFGRARVLVGSAVSSAVGLLLFGLAPSLLLAAVGAVGWGLGAGLVVPIGMASVSGDRLRTAGRVSVISAFGSLASIVAPPLLGIAAEAIGIRHALLFIGGGFLLSIALARTVESDEAQALRMRPGAARRPEPAHRPDAAPLQPRRGSESAAPAPVAAGTC